MVVLYLWVSREYYNIKVTINVYNAKKSMTSMTFEEKSLDKVGGIDEWTLGLKSDIN